jgi:hypothetical protein
MSVQALTVDSDEPINLIQNRAALVEPSLGEPYACDTIQDPVLCVAGGRQISQRPVEIFNRRLEFAAQIIQIAQIRHTGTVGERVPGELRKLKSA